MPESEDWSLEDEIRATLQDAPKDTPNQVSGPGAGGRQQSGQTRAGVPQNFSNGNDSSPRYRLAWKIALVFEEHEHRPTYHGRTLDLSLSGTGMLTNVNVEAASPVVMLIAPPPLHSLHRQKVIEVRAKQQYVVYSGETRCFRLGFSFLEFKDDGFALLSERLKNHQPIIRTLQVRPFTLGSSL